ncbi:MAG: signal peptidase II [Planctomycetota bacterium]|nr:signal peptidase II [Planctomycetota bacterium]
MSAATPTAATPSRHAGRAPAAWLTLLIIFALGLGLDLASKTWSFRSVADEPIVLDRARLLTDPAHNPVPFNASGRPLLPGELLRLKLVLNPGAVFGIGAHQRWFFIVFTVVALGAGLLVFARFTSSRARLAHVALALVLAGGLGNLYDRIAFGRVRDFIQVLPGRRLPFGWTWPGTQNWELFPWVFNVADVLLLIGMILLMIHINRVEKRRKNAVESAPAAGEDVAADSAADA